MRACFKDVNEMQALYRPQTAIRRVKAPTGIVFKSPYLFYHV